MDRLESLERRSLFATVTAAPGGIVRIAGTAGDDHVVVSLYGKSQLVIFDGTTDTYFLKREVKRLTFIGGAGNDSITLGHVQVRAYMEGGDGNDSLSTSDGVMADTLFGGEGNDYLYAGPGNDTLDGGNGGDVELGNAGDDYLECKSELNTDDTVSGGDGVDTVSLRTYPGGTVSTIGLLNPGLQETITDTFYGDIEKFYGSAFDDKVYAYARQPIFYDMGDGRDAVYAGNGDDTIVGGNGQDSIDGGGGNDVILVAGDGAVDSVKGSTGVDYAYADGNDLLKTVDGLLTQTTDNGVTHYVNASGTVIV